MVGTAARDDAPVRIPRVRDRSPRSDAPRFGYRPALDGIRTLAVYLVVAFHSGLGLLPGGFVGVDLFFVLSGFLVTSVVLTEQDARRFSAVRFYARRIRRLLPAAAVTLVATSVMFVGLAPPAEREAAVGDVRSAFLYVSNWHFLRQAQNYFAAEDLPRPFLHFWSLSIEEQFYFAFPLLIIVVALIARRRSQRPALLTGVLAALFVGSLASQLYWAQHDALRAYYATDARLYQLLAGALLALAVRRPHGRSVPRRGPHGRARAGPLALVGVIATVAFVAIASSLVAWSPSTRGLVATGLAVAMLASLDRAGHGPAARGFATAPMAYLGQISYGTYLWHWPIVIALTRLVTIGPVPTFVIAATGATSIAALSQRLLEQPIRRSRFLDRFPGTVVVVGLTASVVLGLLVAPAILRSSARPVILQSGAADTRRVPAAKQAVPKHVAWRAALADTPIETDCLGRSPQRCVLVHGGGLRVHLVGDSHARTLLPLFERIARARGWTFSATVTGACPWQRGLVYRDNEERTSRCEAMQPDWYQRVIPALDPDVVIVFNRAYDDPAFPRPVRAVASADAGRSETDVIRRATDTTVRELVAAHRHVVILEPLPVERANPTVCLSGASRVGDCAFRATAGAQPTETIDRYAALRYPGVASVDLDRIACPDLPVCLPMVDGLVVRRDGHHLTGTFARHIARPVARRLDATGLLGR